MEKIENTAFARVQKARHPDRPYTNDLLRAIFGDFSELHGDRRYADDAAIVGGFTKLEQMDVAVIGQQKGRDTHQRRFRNFGMPKPEGYRKALRIMHLAEKFGRPVITFIDTPGAYPGIDAEERGQAEAIAYNLREMAALRVPTVAVVVGEGGSGGALAIGISDRVLMLENSVYSVISPEGCAAILWKNAEMSAEAAECLKLTALNLKHGELIDEIVPERESSWTYASDNETADLSKSEELNDNEERNDKNEQNDKNDLPILNKDPAGKDTYRELKDVLIRTLGELQRKNTDDLLRERYEKFRHMGVWV